jgi:CheY-like chemotaxis protein
VGRSWPPDETTLAIPADGAVLGASAPPAAVVLIVDDNERHLDILSSLLQAAGFQTETCASGLDALFRLGSGIYSAVVLDMVMPGVNGQGVLDRLRTLSRNSDAPVVVCTANVGIARLQLEERPEIHAIVGKPISSRELVEAVGSAVAAPRRPPVELRSAP